MCVSGTPTTFNQPRLFRRRTIWITGYRSFSVGWDLPECTKILRPGHFCNNRQIRLCCHTTVPHHLCLNPTGGELNLTFSLHTCMGGTSTHIHPWVRDRHSHVGMGAHTFQPVNPMPRRPLAHISPLCNNNIAYGKRCHGAVLALLCRSVPGLDAIH